MILVEDLLESTKQVELAPLKRMLDHALDARGKRLRPALVLLAGTFGDYNLNRLVPLGAAIELLHTASLVHDDVVDGADEPPRPADGERGLRQRTHRPARRLHVRQRRRDGDAHRQPRRSPASSRSR